MLSKATLFDGRGTFPPQAEKIRQEWLAGLKERETELVRRKISAQTGAEQKAIDVGIGKIVEKIIPTYADFKIPTCDCRPLFEPIDIITFNGLSKGVIDSLTFMEIKTGKSRLNQHQKQVKDAVNDRRVSYSEICK